MEKIPINIWDDYLDDESTYAYIEDVNVPLHLQREILLEFIELLQANPLLKETSLSLKFYDSTTEYPKSLMKYKQWQLIFNPLPHYVREELMEQIEDREFVFCGLPVEIYSES